MSRNIGYIMKNGAGNRSQHQLCLQSEQQNVANIYKDFFEQIDLTFKYYKRKI